MPWGVPHPSEKVGQNGSSMDFRELLGYAVLMVAIVVTAGSLWAARHCSPMRRREREKKEVARQRKCCAGIRASSCSSK
jgi:hypothetical protein